MLLLRYFLDAIKIYNQLTLHKADYPPGCEWPSRYQLQAVRTVMERILLRGFSTEIRPACPACWSALQISALTCTSSQPVRPTDFGLANSHSALQTNSSKQISVWTQPFLFLWRAYADTQGVFFLLWTWKLEKLNDIARQRYVAKINHQFVTVKFMLQTLHAQVFGKKDKS